MNKSLSWWCVFSTMFDRRDDQRGSAVYGREALGGNDMKTLCVVMKR
jgi:hypothetical protein